MTRLSGVFALMMLFVALTVSASDQRPKSKLAVSSHRVRLLSRLNVESVNFDVSCARTANHAENQQCVSTMLRNLQSTYRHLSFETIPIPAKFSPKGVVLVFKEDVLMGDDTLTLTVYETEKNSEIYTDSRRQLILSNDLTKLLAGYVSSLEKIDQNSQNTQ